MSWLVDNVNALYVLLIITSAGLVVAWRFNQRVKFLALAGLPLLIMVVLYLLTKVWITDRAQLEQNVREMATAVQKGNVDDLFKHISKDFNYRGQTRESLYELARRSVNRNQISGVSISSFQVLEISRDKKLAKTRFRVRASGSAGEQFFMTEADFVLEGDRWMLKTTRFYNPIADQDQEIGVPGL